MVRIHAGEPLSLLELSLPVSSHDKVEFRAFFGGFAASPFWADP